MHFWLKDQIHSLMIL